MNKVLAFFMLVPMLFACTNGSSTGQPTSKDSAVAVVSAFEEPEPGAIMVKVCDSIAAIHPGNNDIARSDAEKDIKSYVLAFKGQHMPLLEELTYELRGISPDAGKYMAALKYYKSATRHELGMEVQVRIRMTREEAAKYNEGAKYKVRGIVKGCPFASTEPYVLAPFVKDFKPHYSFGAIELTDAELIPQ